MQKLIELIASRVSIAMIVGGVLIFVTGAANGIAIGAFSIAFPDPLGRSLATIAGAGLIVVGIYLEVNESRAKSASRSAGNKWRSPGDNTIVRLSKPTFFSNRIRNRLRIKGDFLNWREGTIMLWVNVPPKGVGLRNPINRSRYLLAHQSGGWDNTRKQWHNLFSIRYRGGDRWEVAISNQEPRGRLVALEDRLDKGWHHFLVRWSYAKSELSFWIDGETGGNQISERFQANWPQKMTQVTIGAFSEGENTFSDSYCETELYLLLVTERFLDVSDPLVRDHLASKPDLLPRN